MCYFCFIGLVGRVFANGLGDLDSLPDQIIPLLHLGVVAIEKGAFWSPLTTVANFTLLIYMCVCVCVCLTRLHLKDERKC